MTGTSKRGKTRKKEALKMTKLKAAKRMEIRKGGKHARIHGVCQNHNI